MPVAGGHSMSARAASWPHEGHGRENWHLLPDLQDGSPQGEMTIQCPMSPFCGSMWCGLQGTVGHPACTGDQPWSSPGAGPWLACHMGTVLRSSQPCSALALGSKPAFTHLGNRPIHGFLIGRPRGRVAGPLGSLQWRGVSRRVMRMLKQVVEKPVFQGTKASSQQPHEKLPWQ